MIEFPDIDTNIKDEGKLRAFLDELEGRLEKIEVEYGETWWKKYLHEPSDDPNEIERRRSEILLNDNYLRVVKEWTLKTHDEHLARRLRNTELLFLRERIEALPDIFQLRNKINEEHIGFKPIVLGKSMDRTDVREMLRKDPDRSRRKAAWESTTVLSRRVESDVVELMKKRNEQACSLGHKTFVDHSLSLNLIDEAELNALYEELDNLTKESCRSALEGIKQTLGLDSLEPWDISYVLDQFVRPPDEHFPKDQIIPKIKELVRSWGMTPERLPILIKQADIPFGGLCFAIKIPTDVRIVSNPRDGHRFYRVLFHEYGHAIHACHVKQKNYVLKHDVGCFNEGMATILEHFTTDAVWLQENTSLSDREIERFVKARRIARLLELRYLMATSTFEFEAYKNLDQDLNLLWSRILSRYVFVNENLTPRWAALSIYTTHPVYYQNYILAEMIAAQTIAYLQEEHGRLLNSSKISKFLIENYYAPGSSIDWPEKIEKATGHKLSAQALAQQLTT